MDFDTQTFTAIMAAFPTGVVVLTTTDEDGAPFGTTLNAVCSVSLEPPLLLACLSHSSQTLPVLRRSGRFAVNFLAEGRGALSAHFASKKPGKFASVAHARTASGHVILPQDIVAHAECVVHEDVDAGDHAVIIGRVTGGGCVEGERPLVYFRRAYDRWPRQREARAESVRPVAPLAPA